MDSVISPPPAIICHRGWWRVPEEQNTLPACIAAAARGWGVEIDAQTDPLVAVLMPEVAHDVGRVGPWLGPFVEHVLGAGAPVVLIDAKTREAFTWAAEHLRDSRVIVRVPTGVEAYDISHPPDRTTASVFDLDEAQYQRPIGVRYLLADHRQGQDWRTAEALEGVSADRAFICNSPEVVGGHLDLPWYAWNWRGAFAVMTDRPAEYERAWRGEDGFSVPLASCGLSYNPERAVVLTRFLARQCGSELRAAGSIIEMGARDGEMVGALVRGMGLTAAVRCEEGRAEHVAWGRRKFPDFDFAQVDYQTADLNALPEADVVLCVGLLYHVATSVQVTLVLERAVRRARRLAVIETEVVDNGRDRVHRSIMTSPGDDQGLSTMECIPSMILVEEVFRRLDVGFTRIATADLNSNLGQHRYDWRIRDTGRYVRGEQRCLWLVEP